MTYELLTSLYFGEGTNADLTSASARALLHLGTPLEQLLPRTLADGIDVVLTGNPGDGKSHLARTLSDRGLLGNVEILLDLSARPTEEVLRNWVACRSSGRRLLLCGNQGPLSELIDEAAQSEVLAPTAKELSAQLRRLVASERGALPHAPKRAMLVDLADRSVLDEVLVSRALARLCSEEFLPPLGNLSTECSAGRNLLMLQSADVRSRLARILALAGRRSGEHVTFRQLWGAISCAVTGAKTLATLRSELAKDSVGLGTSPLDNLCAQRASGLLVDSARRFADPANVADPSLDEWLWSTGGHDSDGWLADVSPPDEPPSRLWARNERAAAVDRQRELKRLVALAHVRGEALIGAIASAIEIPSTSDDQTLQQANLVGIRRLFISAQTEDDAPDWLTRGVPLWVGLTYEDVPAHERPHVAVRALAESDFEVRRPIRAPWLGEALGPLPEVAWFAHRPSGISLRVDPQLLAVFRNAAVTSGPMPIPEPLGRFLARLAGWVEAESLRGSGSDPVVVLDRPRGDIVASAVVTSLSAGGASYG